MANKPNQEFGKRRPPPPERVTRAPVKRSGHVGLLLMGTLAVGGGAYALMPRSNCEPTPPGVAVQPGAECPPRGSSSGRSGSGGGWGSSRSSFYSSDSSSGHAASSTSSTSSGSVTRGGFGSFAHAFGFSGG